MAMWWEILSGKKTTDEEVWASDSEGVWWKTNIIICLFSILKSLKNTWFSQGGIFLLSLFIHWESWERFYCYAQTKRKLTKTFIHLLRPDTGGQRMQVLLLLLHLHHLPLLPPLLLLHQVPSFLLTRLLGLIQAPEDLLEVLGESHGRSHWLGRKWDNSGLKTSSLRFLAFLHHQPPAPPPP